MLVYNNILFYVFLLEFFKKFCLFLKEEVGPLPVITQIEITEEDKKKKLKQKRMSADREIVMNYEQMCSQNMGEILNKTRRSMYIAINE